MTEVKTPEQVTGVRLLSLVLAGLLWLGVTLERPGELKLQVSIVPEHLPAGLLLASAPRELEATVSGPRILLFRQWLRGGGCGIDLSEAQAGPASYRALDCRFGLDQELKVVRVHPATIQLTLTKAAPG